MPYRRERILPNGKLVLVVSLGAGFRIAPGGAVADLKSQRSAWICGLQSRALLNEPLGETFAVGAVCRVGAGEALLGLPLSELTDRVVAADAVFGAGLERLRDRLFHAETAAARLAILERYLRGRLLAASERAAALRPAIARLSGFPPPRIADLAEDLGCSQKHLIALFHRHAGVSPGRLRRILRFNRALDLLNGDPATGTSLAAVAQDCGFVDQAHLNRDFRAFSGVTPTVYRRQRAAVFGAAHSDDSGLFVPIT